MSSTPPQQADVFVTAVANGEQIRLLSLWKDRRIVLCFVRQLGCRFCMDRTLALEKLRNRLAQHQVDTIIVGLGTAQQGRRFVDKTGFGGEMYVDTSSDGQVKTALVSNQAVSYSLMKLNRGVECVVNDKTKELGAKLLEKGIADWPELVDAAAGSGKTGDTVPAWAGDPFQVGGTFVLGPGNQCDFAYRSDYAGDHPPVEKLLESATGISATGDDVLFEATQDWYQRLQAGSANSCGVVRSRRASKREGCGAWGKDHTGRLSASCEATYTTTTRSATTSAGRPSPQAPPAQQATESKVDWSPGGGVKCCNGACEGALWRAAKDIVPALVAAAAIIVGPGAPRVDWAPEALLGAVRESWVLVLVCALALTGAAGIVRCLSISRSHSASRAQQPCPGSRQDDKARGVTLEQEEEKLPELRFDGRTVDFLTPKDIDELLESHGHIEMTSKSAPAGEVPVLGVAPLPSAKEEEATGVTTRRDRGQTWDLSLGVNEYHMIMSYVRHFLSKNHPQVGRKGPVCPFVPQSLRKNTLYLSIIRSGPAGKKEIERFIKSFAPHFQRMEPTTGSARQFKAVIFIFPDVRLEDTGEFIDAVQQICKPYFVKRGLMLGEFHLRNNSPGLRNPDFYPLRTPVPCLAVRHMVPTDLAFLDVEKYETGMRIDFLQSFLQVFGSDRSYRSCSEVESARAALDRALGEAGDSSQR